MTGTLSTDTLAQYVGPCIDFWRLVLEHDEYWLHTIHLSRIFCEMSPLVITTQSAPLAALKARHLVEVWSYFGNDGHAVFMDGVLVGEICIVRFGPNEEHIAIWIVKLHFGSFKYDPVLAGPRWTVMCHARATEETVQRVVSTALRNSPPDLQDPATREAWLNTCFEEARRLLAKEGVLDNLKKAKEVVWDMEQAYGFLRSIISAKTMHDRWLESEDRGGVDRPRGELTAPKGRRVQMRKIARITARTREGCGSTIFHTNVSDPQIFPGLLLPHRGAPAVCA
ncbi:hypothetical protein FB45DRAFT_325579 [Roridomyces roridus]|uniref:Uncharacterized protein n=1 Tax=Roridomyces roridus TaxID=1738132 RepID=A0AAD7B4U0_9AGAR|nr:hypothetical protein FB45DRAFT_325579 [Roridomyces roridus]